MAFSFGSTPAAAPAFGAPAAAPAGGLFGAPAAAPAAGGFSFGAPKPAGSGLFGATPAPAPAGGLFGAAATSGDVARLLRPTEAFEEVYKKAISTTLESLENRLFACHDVVGLLLVLRLVRAQRALMARRPGPRRARRCCFPGRSARVSPRS